MHPIAEQILSLYNTTDDGNPVFPLPNRDALWFEVHELGVTIGKEENLTYHMRRHNKTCIFQDMRSLTEKQNRLVNGLETSELL